MGFKTGNQRKRVMAGLNPAKGPNSSSITNGPSERATNIKNPNKMLNSMDPKLEIPFGFKNLEEFNECDDVWGCLEPNQRFDVIEEKFYNSNLPNINEMSDMSFTNLPDDIRSKIKSVLKNSHYRELAQKAKENSQNFN